MDRDAINKRVEATLEAARAAGVPEELVEDSRLLEVMIQTTFQEGLDTAARHSNTQ